VSLRQRKREDLAAIIDGALREALDILPGKLESLAGDKLAIVVGILFDKRQILLGRPTSIREEADGDELAGLFGRAASRARQAAGTAPPAAQGSPPGGSQSPGAAKPG
jgi:hypothetical protein